MDVIGIISSYQIGGKVNYLVYLGHPAHYHFLKHTIKDLEAMGHKVDILIKTKDILEELLKNDGVTYLNILPEGRKQNKFSIIKALLKRVLRLYRITGKKKYALMIGSEPSIGQVGWLRGIPSIVYLEDDLDVVPEFAKLAFPFAKDILSPISCDLGKWKKKQIAYHGYQKLPYLHPKVFKPDFDVFSKASGITDPNEKVFFIRLSSLSAHHDFGIKGLSDQLLDKVVGSLSKKGKVFISSEGECPEKYKHLELTIHKNDIHHFLFYCSMLVCDSQSMTVEASMLGVPSIRFSDFAGRIGVLEELEKKYGLTYGFKTNDPESMMQKIEELLLMDNIRETFQERRQKMLSEKIAVSEFLTWYMANYPKSREEFKKDPKVQFQFR